MAACITVTKRGTEVPPPSLLPLLDTGEERGRRGPPRGRGVLVEEGDLNAEWLHKEEGHQE